MSSWGGLDINTAFHNAVLGIKKVVNDVEVINSHNSLNFEVDNNDPRILYTYVGNQIYVSILPSKNNSDIKTQSDVTNEIVNTAQPTYEDTLTYDYSEVSSNDLDSILTNTTNIIKSNSSLDGLISDLKSESNSNDIVDNTFFKSVSSNDDNYNVKTFSINKPKNYNKDYYGVMNYIRTSNGLYYNYNLKHYINGVEQYPYGDDSGSISKDMWDNFFNQKVKNFNRKVENKNKLSSIVILPYVPPVDDRIPTNCCLLSMCEPTKYKYVGV